MANLIRAIAHDADVLLSTLDSTNIVCEMERIHRPSAVVSAALGRVLTGASLMGSLLKNPEDSITLRVDGDGPIGALVAVTDGLGNVRGYASHKIVEIPLRTDGKLDVGSAVGHEGTLAVVRDMGFGEPYIGQIPLVSGEIAEDITAYYSASEQTPTSCALGVLVNPDLTIKNAGGFLLQLLPGATEADIQKIENNLQQFSSITQFFEEGGTPYALIDQLLRGFSYEIMEERQVEYKCTCSRERTEQILISLGKKELENMRKENPVAEVECHFCNKKYQIKLDDLLREMDQAKKQNDLDKTV